ncbi:MAG: glycosyltransferase family 4 protein [bacterium]|nr:glycosyltransferase family 4 protein [bacterium]
MKILLVANTLPPEDLSGVGEQVLQLSRGLEERGHEVRILGRGVGGARGPKLFFPLAVVPPFLREVRRFRPEVVQVHESDGALAALTLKTLGSALCPEPKLLALLQVSYWQEFLAVRAIRHEGRVLGRPGWEERRFRWFKAPLQIALGWLTAWLADAVLAPSAATAAELRRDYGVSKVWVVPNATAPVDRSPEAGAVPRHPAALFVGRLRLRKGVEVALHAVSLLESSGFEARLLVVGDGEHRLRLERVSRELGLEDRVQFLGRRSREEVQALMDSSTVLVVPSLYEGMPLVIVEAMQRGLAVAASAVSGIPEVVLDGETGWLVPCEDPVALARALEDALGDPTEARRRGAAGRERLERDYRPEQVASLWEEAVEPSKHGMLREDT